MSTFANVLAVASPGAAAPNVRRAPPEQVKAPAKPPHDPQVVITGELLWDAQMRFERSTQRPTVHAHIAQGAGRPTVRAIAIFDPSDAGAHAASKLAASLRQGDLARITGHGLLQRWERGEQVLDVSFVTRIESAE